MRTWRRIPIATVPAIAFRPDRRGAARSRAPRSQRGKQLAIGSPVVKSAPASRQDPERRRVIQGSFNDKEARDLAIVLRAGAAGQPQIIEDARGPDARRRLAGARIKASLIDWTLGDVLIVYTSSRAFAAVGPRQHVPGAGRPAVLGASDAPRIAGSFYRWRWRSTPTGYTERIRRGCARTDGGVAIEAGYKNALWTSSTPT